MSNTKKIVDKAWNFAHVPRDDGLSYMAYTEQITFLLFLKMADEQAKPPYNKTIVPKGLDWPDCCSATAKNWEDTTVITESNDKHVVSRQAGGFTAISRWLSEATPPETENRKTKPPHPGGMPALNHELNLP